MKILIRILKIKILIIWTLFCNVGRAKHRISTKKYINKNNNVCVRISLCVEICVYASKRPRFYARVRVSSAFMRALARAC